jgi:hypothetical protein
VRFGYILYRPDLEHHLLVPHCLSDQPSKWLLNLCHCYQWSSLRWWHILWAKSILMHVYLPNLHINILNPWSPHGSHFTAPCSSLIRFFLNTSALVGDTLACILLGKKTEDLFSMMWAVWLLLLFLTLHPCLLHQQTTLLWFIPTPQLPQLLHHHFQTESLSQLSIFTKQELDLHLSC